MRPLPETVILRGGGLRRQKLTQHMFVVGDYLSEQASVGLSQTSACQSSRSCPVNLSEKQLNVALEQVLMAG